MAILKVAYAQLGIEVTSEFFPPGRALAESDTGRSDGEIVRIADLEKQYPNLIRIPVPIVSLEGLAFTCSDMAIDGRDSIWNKRIGIMTGIQFAMEYTKGMPNVTAVPKLDKLFHLLKMGRLDVVIATRPNAYQQKLRPEMSCLTVHEPPLVSYDLYHYLHKRHANLVPAITAVLMKMKEQGKIDAIRQEALRKSRTQLH